MTLKIRFFVITLCLFVLAFVVNIPYLYGLNAPIHDTARIFDGFHFFYSQLYFNDPGHWCTNILFRPSNAYYQLISLTPSCYMAMLIGKMLHIRSALFLFNISNLVDQFVFLIGLQLLCWRLFTHKSVIFFVCSGAILCTVWYSQLWWNFRSYYLFPMIIYLLQIFLKKQKPEFLWLSATVFCISLFGNLPSVSIVCGLILTILFVAMLASMPYSWKTLFSKTPLNVICFLLFGFVSIGTFSFAINATVAAPKSFSVGSGNIEAINFLRLLIIGWPVHTCWEKDLGNTVYIGLLPLLFGIYALINSKDNIFVKCIFIIFGFWVWLSSNGVFSSALKYLLGISIIRNQFLVYGPIKILILVSAGFGLEKAIPRIRFKHIFISLIITIYLADHLTSSFWLMSDTMWSIAFIIRLGIYSLFVFMTFLSKIILQKDDSKMRGREFVPLEHPFLILALLICYITDLLIFQYMAFSSPS